MNLDTLRSKLGYQTLLLGSVVLLTTGALALASRVTEADIQAAAARDLKQSLAQVLPGQYDNDLLSDTVRIAAPDGELTVYRARRAGRVEAVVFQVEGRGYAGPIVCVMGVSRDGQLLGVRVLKHKETPGLGDKIEPAKDKWIQAFAGKSLGAPAADQWAVKKDGGAFDQFAGATITPRAVVRAVKGGLERFAREKPRMLDEEKEGQADASRNRSERASTREGQAVVVKPLKRQQPRSAGRARSAGTGMYMEVHEDSEHRTRPDHARAVDL
ncbi:MAG: electron transport complex subunit RsxG [Thiobacillus sp.]